MSALRRLDLPTPRGPVSPTRGILPVPGYNARTTGAMLGSAFSTAVIARASARRSPLRIARATGGTRADPLMPSRAPAFGRS